MDNETVITCETCGADLTKQGAIRYVEQYEACIDDNILVSALSTIDSSATCVVCGALIYYYDVEAV